MRASIDANDQWQKKRVLVAAVGLSPQVVTETLHALWQANAWVPSEIVLLATSKGEELCKQLLLDPNTGALVSWGREWGIEGAERLAAGTSIEVSESDSGDVDDVRAVMAMAEKARAVISSITGDDRSELHVSLAGGRKPMAAILAILMSLHGRPRDRVSHVLVRPEEAKASGFFFPTRRSQPLPVGEGRTINAKMVEVKLFDIPFPRLLLGKGKPASLGEAFEGLLGDCNTARMVVDLESGVISWDGEELGLPPAIAAFLAWAAREQASGNMGLPRVGAPLEGYLEVYRAFAGAGAASRAKKRLADPLDPEWMEEKAARASKLARAFGIQPRGARLVQRVGDRARSVYRLALDARELLVTGEKGLARGQA